MLRRDDDLRLLVVFRFSFFTSSSSFFGRDDSRLLDARDARFSSVTSVSKLLALLLLVVVVVVRCLRVKKVSEAV